MRRDLRLDAVHPLRLRRMKRRRCDKVALVAHRLYPQSCLSMAELLAWVVRPELA